MDKLASQFRRVSRLTILNLVVLAGVVVFVGQASNDADRSARYSERSATAAEDIQAYVEELRTVTPEEAERNAQIGAVLASVPNIEAKADRVIEILCNEFPEATACPEPDGG